MISARTAVLAALSLAACGKAPSTGPMDSGGDSFHGFTRYRGAREICSEHVTGAPTADGTPGPHINWIAFSTTDPVEKVVEHYLAALGRENHSHERGEDLWRFPREKPRRVLSVEPADSKGPWSHCSVPAGAKAVVTMSSMTFVE